MAGSTPTYGLPYPELVDIPDGPAAVKALAEATELELERVDARYTDSRYSLTPGDGSGFVFAAGVTSAGEGVELYRRGDMMHLSFYVTNVPGGPELFAGIPPELRPERTMRGVVSSSDPGNRKPELTVQNIDGRVFMEAGGTAAGYVVYGTAVWAIA